MKQTTHLHYYEPHKDQNNWPDFVYCTICGFCVHDSEILSLWTISNEQLSTTLQHKRDNLIRSK